MADGDKEMGGDREPAGAGRNLEARGLQAWSCTGGAQAWRLVA
jgi:hypothetical protein